MATQTTPNVAAETDVTAPGFFAPLYNDLKTLFAQGVLRNTVLQAAVDGSGRPAYLQGSGAALTAGFYATTTAIVLSFLAGTAPDLTVSITADNASAWTGLTASATNWLYVDRDATTGALTYGATTVATVISHKAPTGATGAHWLDTSTMTMKRWNGSAWVACQRVFMGFAVTNTTNVTSVSPAPIGNQIIAGNLIAPNNSACYAYLNAAPTFSAQVWSKLTFQTVVFDNLGEYDNTTNYRFTAKQDGIYLVSFNLTITTAVAVQPFIRLYKNGTAYAYPGGQGQQSQSSWPPGATLGGAIPVRMSAGDYIEVYFWTTSLSTGIGTGADQTWLTVNKIA